MNKVLMAVTRVGIPIFGDEGPVILTVPGRTSGKPRSTPITPMTVDGHRYVVSGFPGSDWERNARAADSATLRTRRRSKPCAWWNSMRRRPVHCSDGFPNSCPPVSSS